MGEGVVMGDNQVNVGWACSGDDLWFVVDDDSPTAIEVGPQVVDHDLLFIVKLVNVAIIS